MTWVLAATLVLIGLTAGAAARVGRPTVPLGVSVPRAHTHDPVVTGALRRYERGVTLATACCVALLWAPLDDAARGGLVPLVQLALVLVALSVARRPIQQAKEREGWYDDVPVRLIAQVTPDDEPAGFSPWPYVLAAMISLGVVAYGVALYPQLPTRIVTHAGFDGTPDAWAHKSYASALGPAGVPLGLVLVFGLIAWGVSRTPARPQPDGDVVQSRRRADVEREGSLQMLAAITVLMTAAVSALVVFTWHEVTGWPVVVTLVVLMVAPLGFVGRLMWRLIRVSGDEFAEGARPSSSHAVGPGRYADSPDDDRFWKGGVFYVNRDDPRTWVPKRVGIGWTTNLARPGGMAFAAGTVALIVATIVLPLVLD